MTRPLSRRDFNQLVAALGASSVLRSRSIFAAAPNAPATLPFAHPGMLQSAQDLDRMRQAIKAQTPPIAAGFEVLRNHPLSQRTYTMAGGFAEIGRNPNVHIKEFENDSNASYQLALMGLLTGNREYTNLSMAILNSWSASLEAITGADAVLCATLGGFKMANAAELVRHGSNEWGVAEATRFGHLLTSVFLPVIIDFAPFANGNWDTAAMKMTIAIAIYQDDRTLFDRALRYYRFGSGDGRIEHYIYANGQCQESGRDQQHTQLGLAHMGDCCEMAWHQGLDLYGTLSDRLLLGFEYTAKYELGQQVPFNPDVDQTGKYRHTVISERSPLRPVYEQIYNHYVKRRGLEAPWVAKAAATLRPEGPGFGADHTGFGTLLYTRDAGPDTAEAAPFAVPSGLHASPVRTGIELSAIPFASGAALTIDRSPAADAAVLSTDATGNCVDSATRPGQLYSYRARSGGRLSQPVSMMQGLPPDWQFKAQGPLPGDLKCSFEGRSFLLHAGGGKPVSQGGPYAALSRMMPTGGSFTARIVPEIASQFVEMGLVAFAGAEATDSVVCLLVTPRGEAERPAWSATLLRGKFPGHPLESVASVPLAAPTITWGRLSQPLWLRLEMTDASLTGSISEDGASWKKIAESSMPRGAWRAGIFINSGLADVTTEVGFDQVTPL